MRIDLGHGHVYSGSPMEILTELKGAAEGADELDLGEYIEWVIERAATVEGVLLFVGSGPLHVRASNLLREMVAANFARDLEHEEDEDNRATARWVSAREIAAL
jgi:hypothetical protein